MTHEATPRELRWAREPTISTDRQHYLLERLGTTADFVTGSYPFAGVRMHRADLEWLLVQPELPRAREVTRSSPGLSFHTPGGGVQLRFIGGGGRPTANEPDAWMGFRSERFAALDLRGADLTGQDLSDLPLACVKAGLWEHDVLHHRLWTPDMWKAAGTRFDHCLLVNTELVGAVLVGASFDGARLANTQCRGTDMRYSALDGATIIDAGFEFANLSDASMRRAKAFRSRFSGARLGGLSAADSTFEHCYFEGADFASAYHGALFLPHGADLTTADLKDSRFEGAVLGSYVGARLQGANLGSSSFAGATLRRVDLSGTDLTACDLAGADLRDAKLFGAVLGDDYGAARLIGRAPEKDAPPTPDEDFAYLEAAVRGANVPPRPDPPERLPQVKRWVYDYPDVLGAADLRGVYFDESSRLDGVKLTRSDGAVFVEGVRWGAVDLSRINWEGGHVLGDELAVADKVTKRGYDLESLHTRTLGEDDRDIAAAHRQFKERKAARYVALLEGAVRANRQVALTLREQGLGDEADYYSYRFRNLQRQLYRAQNRQPEHVLSFLLWLVAGYGLRPARIFISYVAVVSVFAVLYTSIVKDLAIWDGVVRSINAFHGRGFSVDAGASEATRLLAASEALIGLFVEATLIATFAQRFLAR